jgi:hypothetical protein
VPFKFCDVYLESMELDIGDSSVAVHCRFVGNAAQHCSMSVSRAAHSFKFEKGWCNFDPQAQPGVVVVE